MVTDLAKAVHAVDDVHESHASDRLIEEVHLEAVKVLDLNFDLIKAILNFFRFQWALKLAFHSLIDVVFWFSSFSSQDWGLEPTKLYRREVKRSLQLLREVWESHTFALRM